MGKHIADPVTVFIDLDLASLPGDGVLGQAFSATGLLDYPTSYVLQGASNPTTGNVDVPISGASASGGQFAVNRATLKALGELTPDDPSYLEPDGRIELNNELITLPTGESTFLLDFDRDDGTTSPSQFDGLAVAVHEIGHLLGFVSSLDLADTTIAPTPMDLFRFPYALNRFNPRIHPAGDASNPFEQFQSFTRELRPNVQAMTDFGDSRSANTETSSSSTENCGSASPSSTNAGS